MAVSEAKASRSLAARTPYAILAVLVAAEFTAGFETTMIMSAFKTLIEDFGRPVAVGWLVTGYLLVSAAAAAVCGRLGDLYGRRRVLLVALACAAVGSLVSALASGLEVMILGRALQGMAGAVLPLCFGLVREHLPQAKVPFGTGVITGTVALGTGAGSLVGGVIIDLAGWQQLFGVTCLCAVASFTAVFLFLPRSTGVQTGRSLDIWGGILFVPAVTALLLAVSNLGAWGAGSLFWALLTGGFALLVGWIWHELRHPVPLIDVRLLLGRNIGLANVGMALAALSAFQIVQVLLLLLQQPQWTGIGLGLTATAAALIKLPGSFVNVFVSPMAGHLAGRIGGRPILIAGMALNAAGWAVLSVYNASVWVVAGVALICTMGCGFLYVAVPSLVIANAPADRTSEATGVSSVVRSVFMAVGAQMVVVLLATSTVTDPARGLAEFPSPEAYRLALRAMALICLIGVAVALALPKRAPGTDAAMDYSATDSETKGT